MEVSHGVDERVVLEAWERQTFPAERLQTSGISVIFRGVPSDAGGPDYQDVLLAMGSDVASGDVEFHVLTSDWYRHRHHLDPAYNRVILHVVWHDDRNATLRQDGQSIPTLAVGHASLVPVPAGQPTLAPHPCVDAFRQLTRVDLAAQIVELGLARFHSRAETFTADMTALPADHVVYAAIFEALGYASNRACFRALADLVPYDWIMSIPPAARAGVLLNAAGLGPATSMDPPGSLPAGSWRLSRIRPANHPILRLRGMAALLEGHAPSLARSFAEVLTSGSPTRALIKALTVRDGPEALIGSGRAREIAVSAVLPCVAADGNFGRARDVYLAFPSPPWNRWTRVMLRLLEAGGHSFAVKRAVEHQGLHALYLQHCRLEKRRTCPVCGPGG